MASCPLQPPRAGVRGPEGPAGLVGAQAGLGLGLRAGSTWHVRRFVPCDQELRDTCSGHLKPCRGALSPCRRHPGPRGGGACPQASRQSVGELGHFHDLLCASVCHRNHLPAPESAPSHSQPDPHQTKSWHRPGPRGRAELRAGVWRSPWRPVSPPCSPVAGTREPSCFADRLLLPTILGYHRSVGYVLAVGYVLVPTPRTCDCVRPSLEQGLC